MKHVLKVIIDYGDSTEMPLPIEDFQNAILMLTGAEIVTVSEMN